MKFNKKYTRDIIWGISILCFVACLIMAYVAGSIPLCIAAAFFGTIWMVISFQDHRNNEDHLNNQKKEMHL